MNLSFFGLLVKGTISRAGTRLGLCCCWRGTKQTLLYHLPVELSHRDICHLPCFIGLEFLEKLLNCLSAQ
jgi:hypothetical protein